MLSNEPKFTVGQRVWIDSVNRRRGERVEAVVTKVGRKLVTAEDCRHHRAEVYRIDTGRRNDAYGHEFLMTDGDVERHDAESELAARLKVLGVDFGFGVHRFTIEARTTVAEILEAPGARAER